MNWREEPLSAHTTFKIGGIAKYWIEPDTLNGLKKAVIFAKEKALPVLVIGSGSNMLVSDEGFAGVVIKLCKPDFCYLKFEGTHAVCASGLKLSELCAGAASSYLGGLETLYGIPGTVGGALAGNAGAGEKSICELIEEAQVMDTDGNIKTLEKKQINFGYRYSSLSDYIILSAKFKLQNAPRQEIEDKMKEALGSKKKTQELSLPSAGCVFKNPNGHSAGALIDACGLKGKRVGDAAVSGKHANFIVNLGKATFSDVEALIKELKAEVKNKKGILLEEEIKILGGKNKEINTDGHG
ncbi:MAG: UDP-N-acetylmuramate dehydrogenase [Candidatus Omnitrophota bacterium]